MNTTLPVLIELPNGASVWMSQAVTTAIKSMGRWELGRVDELSLLPQATLNNEYQASFYWCDPRGTEMEHRYLASHVAVVVSGRARIEDCEREQLRLASVIRKLRDAKKLELRT